MTDGGAPGDIVTIDCGYLFEKFAAAYLVVEGDRAAFVDNNTNRALPLLLEALERRGLGPGSVAYIIVTHVHLDHAGCTGRLSRACPEATVLAHPRAARHLVDPARLIRGATAVYGPERFQELYGTIEPVDKNRVRPVQDGERVAFGSRTLTFLHTLGHARHHMVVHDSGAATVFTGDAFGLAYPLLQAGSAPFVFPSSSPPDFHPGEARSSVRRIVETGATSVHPTHFGPFHAVQQGAAMMIEYLDRFESMMVEAAGRGLEEKERQRFLHESMRAFFRQELEKRGLALTPAVAGLLETDISLNARGLTPTGS
jgi:glyoxylase-like metal-dependent hydrolase (beta-lactamase superfamily II)